MKVFILMDEIHYEGTDIIAIYETEEKAIAALEFQVDALNNGAHNSHQMFKPESKTKYGNSYSHYLYIEEGEVL